MKKILSIPLLALALLLSLPSYALSPAGQRYIELLTNGGPVSIRDAAKSVYNTGEKDQQVLDTLAETLLTHYQNSGRDYIDAMSWAAKALGSSGNARYRDTLQEVIDSNAHKKLKKYAQQSLNRLGSNEVEQYRKGALSLTGLTSTDNTEKPETSGDTALQPLSVVKTGMSMQEVYDLVGQPSATTSRQTGKAWIPFNFKGSDNVRTIALYKGQGRVVFSNESNFSSGWRVLEIQLNEDESGFP